MSLKSRQDGSVAPESPILLIPINLFSECSASSQSWPLKFEHDLTLCLQLSDVFATTWLLPSSGFYLLTPKHVQKGEGGHDRTMATCRGSLC